MDYNEKDWISNYHGMELSPDAAPDRRGNENGILFLVEYYFLKHLLGELTHADIAQFQIIVENLRAYDKNGVQLKGLYDRGAGESLWDDKSTIRTISLDNLTAIAAFSRFVEDEYNIDLGYHKNIRTHARKSFGRFDNVYPEKQKWSRIQLPWHLALWSYMGYSFIGRIFSCLTMLAYIFSCRKLMDCRHTGFQKLMTFFKTFKWPKEEKRCWVATSGKLLAFTGIFPIRKTWMGRLTWWICCKYMEKHFDRSWEKCFAIYFRDVNNPINIKMRKVYSRNKRLW